MQPRRTMGSMTWAWWRDTWSKLGQWTKIGLVGVVAVGGVSLYDSWQDEPERADVDRMECELHAIGEGRQPFCP